MTSPAHTVLANATLADLDALPAHMKGLLDQRIVRPSP